MKAIYISQVFIFVFVIFISQIFVIFFSRILQNKIPNKISTYTVTRWHRSSKFCIHVTLSWKLKISQRFQCKAQCLILCIFKVFGIKKLKLSFHFHTLVNNNTQIRPVFTVFGPLLTESLLHKRGSGGTFDSCNQYVNCKLKMYFVISICPANEWMWTPDLETLQFHSGDTAVMASSDWCIQIVSHDMVYKQGCS